VPVTFETLPEMGISVDQVEAHISEGDAKPVAQWIDAAKFVLRASSPGVGSLRELWIRSKADSGHQYLVVFRVSESDEAHIALRAESIKKKERIKESS